MKTTIILAAGQGKRLLPHTKNSPKCLVPISSDQTILSHQLDNLKKANLGNIVILTGYQHNLIKEHIASFKKDLNIALLYFPYHETSGNLMTLWSAKYFLNDEVVIINGDNVFDWKILKKLFCDDKFEGSLLANKKSSYDNDDMLVSVEKDILTGVSKTLPRNDISGESIGIMYFNQRGARRLKKILGDIVINHPHAKDLWYLHAVDTMAKKFHSIKTKYIGKYYWFEIDFPKDLKRVQNYFKK